MRTRLSATLRFACEIREPSIALEVASSLPLYSKARRKAVNVAIELARTPGDFRMVHQFTEPHSKQEHRAVLRWAQAAKTRDELVEVLEVTRRLTNIQGLERFIVKRLRPLGYRDWWEPLLGFFRTLAPSRKLA